MRSLKSLVFVPALALAVFFLALAPLHAQSAADDGNAILLLHDEDLAGAATECGIGIAGERTEPVASAAVPLVAIGIGKWVAGLVAGHIKGVITRRLGMDEQYNRFLALSRQLRQIEGQLKALDERISQLSEQINAVELRNLSATLAKNYVNPVKNGTHNLETLACEEASVLNAERMGRDAKRAKLDRDRALAEFGSTCQRTPFQNIPHDLTAQFKSGESILDRYLSTVILPRRYLTRQDSQDLDDFSIVIT
ncbi:hypothetical protein ELE36_00800 [Pseudolysobacter antarcticus]|uniref:Uncharacterized protein n=1 Tax=Pseudolysobacter antarcticus TaxID=2511995 RepID=A0A411HF09_9GAMM|nr:hypothetical protein [Pseudolysobacter antarcticus]QBB69034.1 hypothetical protein ELE36_00800 [Pseudolysobacter antarcticus]